MAQNRSLGNLFIDVDLRTQRLERDVQTLRGRFTALGRTIGGLTALWAGARFIQETARWAEELRNTSENLGLTVRQVQALRDAAADVGVGTRQVEIALQRLTRRASEAAQGAGEALGAFEELGLLRQLQAGQLNNTDDLFNAVADALAEVNETGEKTRLLFKLFDSEGVQPIRALLSEFGNLTGVVEENAVALDERGVAALVAWKGVATDAIQSVVNLARNSLGQLAELFADVAGLPVSTAFLSDEAIIIRLQELQQELEGVEESIRGGGSSIENWLQNVLTGQTQTEEWRGRAAELRLEIRALNDELNDRAAAQGFIEDQRAAALELVETEEAADRAALKLLDLNVAFLEIEESMGIFQEDLGQIPEVMDDATAKAGTLETAVGRAGSSVANSWGSAVAQMVTDSERSFDEILTAFGQMITQMIIQRAVAGLVGAAFGSFLGPAGSQIGAFFGGAAASGTGQVVNVLTAPGTQAVPVGSPGAVDVYVENTMVKSVTSRGPAGQAIERTFGLGNPGQPGGSF